MYCIARAFMDKPLRRAVVEVRRSGAYVVEPSYVNSVRDDSDIGVMFPLTDLFRFYEGLLDELVSAYDSYDRTSLKRLWNRAEPLPL